MKSDNVFDHKLREFSMFTQSFIHIFHCFHIISAMHAVIITDSAKNTFGRGITSDMKIRADFGKIVMNYWHKITKLCLNNLH